MKDGAMNTSNGKPTIGFRVGICDKEDGLELAVVDGARAVLEVLRVAEEPLAVLRVVRRWHKSLGLDPLDAAFCVQEGRPWPTVILERLLAQGWNVSVLAMPGAVTGEDGSERMMSAAEIALATLAFPSAIHPLTGPLLRADKLESLRARRERIMSLRSGLQTESARNERYEAELRREFERMDRRHLQTLDKLLARLDTLINLQQREA